MYVHMHTHMYVCTCMFPQTVLNYIETSNGLLKEGGSQVAAGSTVLSS